VVVTVINCTPAQNISSKGALLGLRIAGQGNVVIINSVDAARDLLVRRGQIYSDRTFSIMDDLCVTAISSSDIYLIYTPRGGWHFNVGWCNTI